ncbi:MAG: pimeloyl-ACP methyl ester esterase BioH [Gammaproteobacteria bacterium]|nr:pimeloyl-ACP methyl ester esterase BioH [Gammaproteobacteria bacterium]
MTLYYEQHGAGQDIVLLHGWGLHGGIWASVTRELSTLGRIVVPDLPGHGRSRDFMPREFTPEALAEEVQKLLNGPAVWIGWSLGGLIALAAAQKFPQNVAKLVLVGATPKFIRTVDWPHAMDATVLDQFALALERDYAGTLTRFLSLQVAAAEDRETLRQLRQELFQRGEPNVAALRAGLHLLKEEDRRAVLGAISTPTLIMQGERDQLVSVGAARYLAAHLPHARLEIIPRAGHAPFLSHAAFFIETLTDFMHG